MFNRLRCALQDFTWRGAKRTSFQKDRQRQTWVFWCPKRRLCATAPRNEQGGFEREAQYGSEEADQCGTAMGHTSTVHSTADGRAGTHSDGDVWVVDGSDQ